MTYEELLAYLKLVPEAVQDPAFYSIAATGLDPQQAAAQNISGQNQLLQAGAGALAGLASIGNTFANAVDPLARAAENYFGPITLGGLLPTVDQARQTRDEGASNYNALYGGSIPAAVGKNILQDAVLGPIARAGGAAIGSVAPSVAAGFNKLLGSGRVGQVAGGAAAGTGNALLGTGLFASDSEQPFVDQLLQNAVFGAGFGGLGGVAGNQGPLRAASNDAPPPVARPVGPGYYGLEDAVLKAEGAPKAATADKWLQWVNGAQARGQLSKEERADVGLDDWLEEKAATGEKVTREDIQQFVTQNAPQLKVVVPGGGVDSHAIAQEEYNLAFQDRISTRRELLANGMSPEQADEAVVAMAMQKLNDGVYRRAAEATVAKNPPPEKPRYEYYQWDKDNARDYHERIVQLQDRPPSPEVVQQYLDRAKSKGLTVSPEKPSWLASNQYQILGEDGRGVGSGFGNTPDEALLDFFATNRTSSRDGLPPLREKPYTHAHWDEENPLAHWRANVRDTLVDDGVPSYHIEEIQSDWHQQAGTAAREVGRDDYTGYLPKPGSRAQKQYNKLDKELGEAEVASAQAWKAWDKQQDEADRRAAKINAGGGTDADMKAYEDAMAELRRLEVARYEARTRVEAARAAMPYKSLNTASYPDAPFKRSWEQLTFKSALKEAVDRGLTRISWTPGQLQSTATGQEKNTRGNDERYNKRLVNIANDLGKKYGTRVLFETPPEYKLDKLGLKPTEYVKPGPIAGNGLFLIVDNPVERGKYIIAPKRENRRPAYPEDDVLYELMAKVKKYAGPDAYNKVREASYDSIEDANKAVNGLLDKLPKVPYMNLTPRMVEDVKNGKLKLY